MSTKGQGVRRDAFVKSVRPDPKSNEELVLLQGYVGDSDQNGYIRVYADPTLSDFIELLEKDICYADSVSTEEDPLGGSRLWVRKTTVFTAGEPGHVNRVKSSFLEGDIVKAFGDTGNIPTVVARPLSLGGNCTVTAPVTRFRSCLAVCFSRNNITCEVNGGETIQTIPATRFRSCIAICNISRNNVTCEVVFTMNQTACRLTRQPVRCSLVCTIAECQAGTIRLPTTIWTNTTVVNPTIEQINPVAQQQFGTGYTGGFDPYQTANLGY